MGVEVLRCAQHDRADCPPAAPAPAESVLRALSLSVYPSPFSPYSPLKQVMGLSSVDAYRGPDTQPYALVLGSASRDAQRIPPKNYVLFMRLRRRPVKKRQRYTKKER